MKFFKRFFSQVALPLLFISLCVVGISRANNAPKSSMTQEEIEAAIEEAKRLFPEDVPGEEDLYRAEKLLISATGSQKPLRLAPSVASVVTSEEIEAMGATTLDQILETVPGVHVSPSSVGYMLSIWSIRGIHTKVSPHVLLLVNGTPYDNSYNSGRSTNFNMPVSMISRVEVVRGPGSALHGADAYAGVVNVVTKDAFEIDGTTMGMRAGSFDSYDFWGQHGGTYNGWNIAIGLESNQTGGDLNRVVEQDSVYFLPGGGAAFSNAPGALDMSEEMLTLNSTISKGDWQMHVYSFWREFNAGLGAGQAVTYGNDLEVKNLLVDVSYNNDHLFTDWELGAKVYYSHIASDVFLDFFPYAYNNRNQYGNPLGRSDDGAAEFTASYNGFLDHSLRMSTGVKFMEYEPDQYKNFGPAAAADPWGAMVHVTSQDHIYVNDNNRWVWHALLQDEWTLAPSWHLTAGIRYDDYSDYGSTTNPRAALVWEARYDLTVKLLYGSAFRGPSFGEQGVKNNPVSLGNPNLKPEKIQTYELAFDYQPIAAMRYKLNLFTYRANDLIELVGSAPGYWENYSDQEGSGVEFEVDWHVNKEINLVGNFAYQRSENRTIDAVVHDAPAMQFYLSPTWDFMPNWTLNCQYFWIGQRHREKGDPRSDISDYDKVDLTLRRTNIRDNWDVALSVKNLFDDDIREPSSYRANLPAGSLVPFDVPMESREIWAELRYNF